MYVRIYLNNAIIPVKSAIDINLSLYEPKTYHDSVMMKTYRKVIFK